MGSTAKAQGQPAPPYQREVAHGGGDPGAEVERWVAEAGERMHHLGGGAQVAVVSKV